LLFRDYPHDWEYYKLFAPVFEPRNMSPEELYQGLVDSYSALSSFGNSLKRGLRTFVKTRSMFSLLLEL